MALGSPLAKRAKKKVICTVITEYLCVTDSSAWPSATSIPSSSFSSRWRHRSMVSFASRLPPGNSHNPAKWLSGRLVMSSFPSRKTRPAATSIGLSANALVGEAQLLHLGWIEHVATVEKNGRGHSLLGLGQVQFLKQRPLRCHHECITPLRNFVHLINIRDSLSGEGNPWLFPSPWDRTLAGKRPPSTTAGKYQSPATCGHHQCSA